MLDINPSVEKQFIFRLHQNEILKSRNKFAQLQNLRSDVRRDQKHSLRSAICVTMNFCFRQNLSYCKIFSFWSQRWGTFIWGSDENVHRKRPRQTHSYLTNITQFNVMWPRRRRRRKGLHPKSSSCSSKVFFESIRRRRVHPKSSCSSKSRTCFYICRPLL